MDENVMNHVESSLLEIRKIFIKAAEQIEALAPGEKIAATELAEQIGKEYNIQGPILYPTLKFLFNGYPGIDVKRGRFGGLIKQ
jgi:hypothetical protein